MTNQKKIPLNELLKKPIVTYSFLAIQLIIFLLMTMDGGSENSVTLIKYGAKENTFIAIGQWWRLVTPMFVHIGALHIIVNSVTLYYLGIQLEGVFGHLRFALIYLLSGIAGNVASFAFNDAISAGASTALFGLFGTALMLAETFRHNVQMQEMAKTFGIFIGLNLVTGFMSTSVDNSGHIGGLIGGFLIATAISVPKASSDLTVKRILAGVAYLIAIAFFIAIGFKKMQIGL
ncbi:rhomboid family intramembrane serine protease [Carnobacterium divergens]|uniref:rhomboid family intramembrane serine protease n=1 Tax=Carnobacterium divergens TaxID=2748 RepID=UPI0030B8CE53